MRKQILICIMQYIYAIIIPEHIKIVENDLFKEDHKLDFSILSPSFSLSIIKECIRRYIIHCDNFNGDTSKSKFFDHLSSYPMNVKIQMVIKAFITSKLTETYRKDIETSIFDKKSNIVTGDLINLFIQYFNDNSGMDDKFENERILKLLTLHAYAIFNLKTIDDYRTYLIGILSVYNQITNSKLFTTEYLLNMFKVEHLDLGFTSIREGSSTILMDVLKDYKLISLNLKENDFGIEEGKAIASALQYNLEKLSISFTKNSEISKHNVLAIIQSLCSKDCNLRELDLSHNYISEEVVTAISNAIKDPTFKLEILDIRNSTCKYKDYNSILESMNIKEFKLKTLLLNKDDCHKIDSYKNLKKKTSKDRCKISKKESKKK